MKSIKEMHMLTYLLVVIGALNWGLVGAFDLNLVSTFFGAWPGIEKLIYIVVGGAAVVELLNHKRSCGFCSDDKQEMTKKAKK